jgi:hypothetical protein
MSPHSSSVEEELRQNHLECEAENEALLVLCGIMDIAMPNGTGKAFFTSLVSRPYENDVGIHPYQV